MSDTAGVRLLVWDDPDIQTGQGRVTVSDLPAGTGVDLEQVYLWLADRCLADETAEACLFTTVAPGQEAALAESVTAARKQGFAVHARRPSADGGSMHHAMTAMIDSLERSGQLREVVVASHDAAGFGPRLDALVAASVPVVVVGFRELANGLAGRAGVSFVDVEDIPGAYGSPLARTNLYDLPVDGRTLPALQRPTRVRAAATRSTKQPPSASALASLLTGSPAGAGAQPSGGAATIDLTSPESVPPGPGAPAAPEPAAAKAAQRSAVVPPAPPPPPVPPAPRAPREAVAPWQSGPVSPSAPPAAPTTDATPNAN